MTPTLQGWWLNDATIGRHGEFQQPITQQQRSAAQRLRTMMATGRLAFTWLGVRKPLAPEQRTAAARAFHADRKLLSAVLHGRADSDESPPGAARSPGVG